MHHFSNSIKWYLCVYFSLKITTFYQLKVCWISDLREVQKPGGLTLTFVANFKHAKGVLPLPVSSSILNVFSHWLGFEAPSRIFQVTSAFTWKNRSYVKIWCIDYVMTKRTKLEMKPVDRNQILGTQSWPKLTKVICIERLKCFSVHDWEKPKNWAKL